jgi:HPt (histidine-containing phosphotransfer) domain-containing protein
MISSHATLHSTYAHEPEMAEVLALYVAQLPGQVRQLHALLNSQRLGELRRLVHQIKGSAGGYGFMCITDAAASAEWLLDNSASIDRVPRAIGELSDLMRSVEGFDAHDRTGPP